MLAVFNSWLRLVSNRFHLIPTHCQLIFTQLMDSQPSAMSMSTHSDFLEQAALAQAALANIFGYMRQWLLLVFAHPYVVYTAQYSQVCCKLQDNNIEIQ